MRSIFVSLYNDCFCLTLPLDLSAITLVSDANY